MRFRALLAFNLLWLEHVLLATEGTCKIDQHDFCLCGIVSYFNPAKFKSRLVNYKKFRKNSLEQGLWLLTVELSFGESYELEPGLDADMLLQINGSARNVMWQKERLLNIAVQNLPDECENVVWPDAELLFGNKDWISETCSLLKTHMFVQPFTAVYRLPQGLDEPKSLEHISVGKNKSDNSSAIYGIAFVVAEFGNDKAILNSQYEHGFTGFAWATRKCIIQEIGLYDYGIVGGGDALIAHSLFGHFRRPKSYKAGVAYTPYYYRKHFSGGLLTLQEKFMQYSMKLYEMVNGSVYYVNGTVYHLWHGSKESRQYSQRFQILRKGKFDPDNDIILKNKTGFMVWEWASFDQRKERMHAEVWSMFVARNEDGEASHGF